jgi:alkylated DNA repair dioxygenase AlkB
MSGAGTLFEDLLEQVPWQAERRQMYERVVDVPRLLCFYGEDDPLPHPQLVTARESLNAHYGQELGELFTSCRTVPLRDGRDSVAWHGDTIGRGKNEDTWLRSCRLAHRASSCCAREAAGQPSGTHWVMAI